MTVLVTVNDLTFNDDTLHTAPVRWSLTIDAGWDAPELDHDLLPTIGEGSALGRVMVRHRSIVCSGTCVTASEADYWQSRATIEGLVPVYSSVPFIVHEPSGAQQVMVHGAPGNPRIRDIDGRSFEFQLVLTALDPTKTPVA